MELAYLFDQDEYEPLGLDLRFWSTFEWAMGRLFELSVRASGQQSLRAELVEAAARMEALTERLGWLSGEAPPNTT